MVPPSASPNAHNTFSALEAEGDVSTIPSDMGDSPPEGSIAMPAAAMPTSQTAQKLLLARIQEGSTTVASRASDPVYVESLVQALRDRARDLARVRQYVAQIKAENDRRANALGDACFGLETSPKAAPISVGDSATANSNSPIGADLEKGSA